MTIGPYGWLNRPVLAAAAAEQAAELKAANPQPDSLRRSEQELLNDLHWPSRHHALLTACDPGPSSPSMRPKPILQKASALMIVWV